MSSGPRPGSDTGSADDVQKLQQEIRQTREHMGETVEQLAAKADVKARARVKAAHVAGQMRGAAGRARDQAAARTRDVRDRLAGPAGSGAPDRVRQALADGARGARRHRTPLAVAAGVLVAGMLAIRRWRRR
jgi:Protein of unknown function (DUF3618)